MLILICLWILTPLYCWNVAKEGIKQHIIMIICNNTFFLFPRTYLQRNNFRKTEHNHQQWLRRRKHQGGHRSSIFPHFVFKFSSGEFEMEWGLDCHLKSCFLHSQCLIYRQSIWKYAWIAWFMFMCNFYVFSLNWLGIKTLRWIPPPLEIRLIDWLIFGV